MVAACSTPADTTLSLILLADDDADTREVYRFCLTPSGFAVEEAADGREALSKARSLFPSAVVTDIRLPGIDGFDLWREIKRNQLTAHIPVIGMAGYSGESYQARAEEAGFDGYLLKPVAADELIAEIRRAILAVRETRAQSSELRKGASSLRAEVRAVREDWHRTMARARALLRNSKKEPR